jgi:hypothetical protein
MAPAGIGFMLLACSSFAAEDPRASNEYEYADTFGAHSASHEHCGTRHPTIPGGCISCNLGFAPDANARCVTCPPNCARCYVSAADGVCEKCHAGFVLGMRPVPASTARVVTACAACSAGCERCHDLSPAGCEKCSGWLTFRTEQGCFPIGWRELSDVLVRWRGVLGALVGMFVATFSQTLGSQGGRAATAEEGEDQGEEEEDERDGEKEDEEEAPGGEEERKEGDEGERRRREGRERRVRMRTTARMQEHGGSARAAFERAARGPPPESYYSYPFGMIDI